MRTLFFETTMGASGDMILGALLGLLDDREAFVESLNAIGMEGLEVRVSAETSMGIAGNRVHVLFEGEEEGEHGHHHAHHNHHGEHKHGHQCCGKHKHHHAEHPQDVHRHEQHNLHEKHHEEDWHEKHKEHKCCGKHNHKHEMLLSRHRHAEHQHMQYQEKHKCCGKHHNHQEEHHDPAQHKHHHAHRHNDLASIGNWIDKLNVSERIKNQAKEIYQIIGQAEALAHNKEVNQIHFHEVGEKDAIFDIVAVCLAMEKIGAEKILSTPVHVGYGKVKTSHGKLPIPTPATAEILRGVPIYSKTKGELCTPTGAALLKYFVQEFTQMPLATWEKIGYGVGSKEFKEPNILRAFLGHADL